MGGACQAKDKVSPEYRELSYLKLMSRRKLWRKKDAAKFDYPYKEVGPA
jgi:hypothetical protein